MGERDEQPGRGGAGSAALAPDGRGADGPAADGTTAGSLLFLLGLLAFLGSAVAFVVDLATGSGVVRSLAVNAASALLLVAWAAHDTLSDPDSDVRTLPGALGTAMLLTGGYFLLAGVVLGATSLWHDRLDLALSLGAAGVAGVVVGFAVFPVEVVLDRGSESDGDEPETH